MNDPTFWLTTAIVVLVIGSGFVSLIRDVQRAAQFGLAITGIALAAVVVTAFIFYREGAVHPRAFCMGIVIDELNTPRFLIVAT